MRDRNDLPARRRQHTGILRRSTAKQIRRPRACPLTFVNARWASRGSSCLRLRALKSKSSLHSCRRLSKTKPSEAVPLAINQGRSTMLFHTWPFFLFLLIVLPVFFALRKTRMWLPWLTVASYFFYGWWNPYYLFLVVYSTVLDFCLVALMDHCPRAGQNVDVLARLTRLRFDDRVLRVAFVVSVAEMLGSLATAWVGPQTLRPTMAALSLI